VAVVASTVAHVVSVNVGRARTFPLQGRQVRTGIWKRPVDGPVAFAGVNLDGDDQADRRVHGGTDKAIYAYATEDYDWWHAELGSALLPGTFGENLTTAGVDPNAAVLGEVWAVGTGRLQVTEPRLPCYKLAMRMGDSGFPDRFAEAGRFGTYLRILEGGEIGAGDVLRREFRPDHGVTVAMVAEAHHSREPAHAVRLLEAGAHLTEGWREWVDRQLERDQGRRSKG
jgi:MOSC domain-containing protein YiiM